MEGVHCAVEPSVRPLSHNAASTLERTRSAARHKRRSRSPQWWSWPPTLYHAVMAVKTPHPTRPPPHPKSRVLAPTTLESSRASPQPRVPPPRAHPTTPCPSPSAQAGTAACGAGRPYLRDRAFLAHEGVMAENLHERCNRPGHTPDLKQYGTEVIAQPSSRGPLRRTSAENCLPARHRNCVSDRPPTHTPTGTL